MKILGYIMVCIMLFSGCKGNTVPGTNINIDDATQINLSDSVIKVNGAEISEDKTAPVYKANDIVYYPQGKDFTFGEGDIWDAFPYEVAINQTVVHITNPGVYEISGKLSMGQIAVDLGEDAKDDPDAVVTLVLNNVDLNCDVAPAVIFYNVYECGEKDEETATMDVDTTSAGANIVIADGSKNTVNGEYVAKIYKSVELSEDGTEVVDSKKLHKYDAAFYSKMSMNVYGEKKGDGVLNIYGSNEGLGTELHLTINGGIINIKSGNDGINTNEDNISVTTINGGELNITVTGETGEGDGIDSNGWLIINGGKVTASACGKSADSGIDSDKGIHINGGTVMASGNMLDRLEGTQSHSVFHFDYSLADMSMKGGNTYTIKNSDGDDVLSYTPENSFTNLVFSSDRLTDGEYSLWLGDKQLKVATGGGMGGRMPMGLPPEDGERPNIPEGERPQRPENAEPRGPRGEFLKGEEPPKLPGGKTPGKEFFEERNNERMKLEYRDTFTIKAGANQFMVSMGE